MRQEFVTGKGVNEIVIFSVGSRSVVSIPGEENFILVKDPTRDGTKPGSSLFSLEGSLG
jgi:predicted phage tail protein